jgi:protein gp37
MGGAVMDNTKIEWADSTLNPIRARGKETRKVGWFCEHVTPGCEHCYAEAMNRRLGTGIDFKRQNRDRVELFLDEKLLTTPLRWLKPRRIFWNSMTDTFGDFVPDEFLDRQFAVMAVTPQHTHLLLTKRAKRMREYMTRIARDADSRLADATRDTLDEETCNAVANYINGWSHMPDDGNPLDGTKPRWPLPNVWLGCSVEDQRRADERIPELLATPAAKRFISAEPLLGSVNLIGTLTRWQDNPHRRSVAPLGKQLIDWIIVGGESGPGARPFDIAWAQSLIGQCRAARVACFVKQLGARPYCEKNATASLPLKDKKGGNWSEWPSELRMREMPA